MSRLTWGVGGATVVLVVAVVAAARGLEGGGGGGGGPPAAEAQQGQPLRLAFINSRLIMANTPGRAEAESTFQREYALFQAEVQRLQQQLDSSIAEYNRTALVLSPAAKQAKEQEIRRLEARVRQRAEEIERQAAQREQDLVAPIMQRVNAVIEGIRAEFNYAMIFDATAPSGALVTADRALDISALVIQRLQSGSAPTPPAPGVQPAGRPPLPPDTQPRRTRPPR